MEDIKNEVEAPKIEVVGESKENIFVTYLKELWVALLWPAFQEFWKAHGTEVLANLKTLGLSLIKNILTKKGNVDEK